MNESTARMSVVSHSAKSPKRQIHIGKRYLASCVVLAFVNFPNVAFSDSSCPGIHVNVLNIRNSTGSVACALFESSAGFPAEYLHFATNIMVIKVRDKEARCDFENIAPGTYALAIVHDENMNGKLDTNWLGIPTEGYAFSNDAKALLGPPSFSAASFSYNTGNLEMTISMHY